MDQVGGIVGGNGLFKASAFGPKNGTKLPETEEGKRKFVEERIVELEKRGGWHEGIDKRDESLPVWQRRGFNWTWHENGDLKSCIALLVSRILQVSHFRSLGGMRRVWGLIWVRDP